LPDPYTQGAPCGFHGVGDLLSVAFMVRDAARECVVLFIMLVLVASDLLGDAADVTDSNSPPVLLPSGRACLASISMHARMGVHIAVECGRRHALRR
jgi:hypothetical protein